MRYSLKDEVQQSKGLVQCEVRQGLKIGRLREVKVEAERLQMRPREILRLALRKMEPPGPPLDSMKD